MLMVIFLNGKKPLQKNVKWNERHDHSIILPNISKKKIIV